MKLVIFSLVFLCLVAANELLAQSVDSLDAGSNDNATVLPDLVVSRKTDLENVVYESDDSISLTEIDIATVHNALNSGYGVAINFDLEFAGNTAVMTAEGKDLADVLIGALKYIRASTSFEIQFDSSRSGATTKSLSNARAQSLLSRLNSRYGAKHGFSLVDDEPRVKSKTPSKASDRVEIWPFSIVNAGLKTDMDGSNSAER